MDHFIQAAPERDYYSIEETRARIGNISRGKLYQLIGAGLLESCLIGGRRLVPADSIRTLKERVPQDAPRRRSPTEPRTA
jgi:hypothetical protein